MKVSELPLLGTEHRYKTNPQFLKVDIAGSKRGHVKANKKKLT